MHHHLGPKLSSITAALLLAALPAAHAQAGKPIRIGVVAAKQGVFAEPGTAAGNGAQMAVEQSGAKLLGRPVEVLWYDDPSPQAAQQNITRMIEEDKVVAIVGGTNSASGLAMAAVAKRSKIPLIVHAGVAREITGKECNRYTFRTAFAIPAATRALGPMLLEKGKRWYFISANYAMGQDAYASMKTALQAAGGQEVGSDQVPLGTNDFSSFILKIRQAKPDVLYAGLAGNDMNNMLKQLAEYGMKDKPVVAAPTITDSSMWAVGPDAAAGYYTKSWQYTDPANTADEKQFTKAWIAKFGKPPAIEAWQGWTSMRMMLMAIDKAQSTDGPAIVKSLETLKITDGAMPAYYRDWDHQFVHSVLVVKGRAPTADKWDMLEVVRKAPASATDLDALFGSKAEVGCTLGDL